MVCFLKLLQILETTVVHRSRALLCIPLPQSMLLLKDKASAQSSSKLATSISMQECKMFTMVVGPNTT